MTIVNTRFLSIIISVAIIILLYWQIDFEKIIQVFLQANILWIILGLTLVVPITLLTAFRLTFLSLYLNKIDFLEALKLILAASVMNLILPSKMGDVAKGVFIVREKGITYAQAIPLVVFEKISDLLALLLWCIFGLLFLQNYSSLYVTLLAVSFIFFTIGILSISSKAFVNFAFKFLISLLPNKLSSNVDNFKKGWLEIIDFINNDKIRGFLLSLLSIFLWFLHLLQIWIFIIALSPGVDFFVSLAITPLAIFAGLLPLTFSGIGTRDFAFIYLYAAYFSIATGAALGILATLRYIIPALVGIPFFFQYSNKSLK